MPHTSIICVHACTLHTYHRCQLSCFCRDCTAFGYYVPLSRFGTPVVLFFHSTSWASKLLFFIMAVKFWESNCANSCLGHIHTCTGPTKKLSTCYSYHILQYYFNSQCVTASNQTAVCYRWLLLSLFSLWNSTFKDGCLSFILFRVDM